MGVVLLALVLAPGNVGFLGMDPTRASDPASVGDECLQVRKPVPGSFKGASGVSVSFRLTQTAGIPSDFYRVVGISSPLE